MKLYTEEDILRAYDLGLGLTDDEVLAEFTPIELPSYEELAILFHNKYEELAPKFEYETRKDTKTFDKETNNGKLMIAVCKYIIDKIKNQQQ